MVVLYLLLLLSWLLLVLWVVLVLEIGWLVGMFELEFPLV